MRAHAAIYSQRAARQVLGRLQEGFCAGISRFPIFSSFSLHFLPLCTLRAWQRAAIQDPQAVAHNGLRKPGSRREARYDRPFCVYHPRERELNPNLPACPAYHHHDPSSLITRQQHRPNILLLSPTQHHYYHRETPPTPVATNSHAVAIPFTRL
jgi:hypothetical protein